MAGKPLFALIALILVAGAILLNIFVILSGTGINVTPINKIYFLSADTSGVSGAPPTSAWTYFSLGSLSGSTVSKSGPLKAAFPFDPQSNFGSTAGIPAAFIGSRFYFYMSRVSWSFYLIAAFFGVCTLGLGVFACCARIAGFLSGFVAFMAMASQAVCAALMTAWTVKARQTFRSNGQASDLGRYAYGFTWAAFLCYFLAMILFCSSGGKKKEKHHEETGEQYGEPQNLDHNGQPIVMTEDHQQPVQSSGGGILNWPGHNTTANKNRESGIKDEYS